MQSFFGKKNSLTYQVWGVWRYLVLLLGTVSASYANPPFLIDNPEPTDYQHWELYFYLTDLRQQGSNSLQAPGIEVDFGAAPNWQLHLVAAAAANIVEGESASSGFGDVELGALYRFIQETDQHPQMGIFPKIEIPSGDPSRDLGNGHVWFKLPILFQKSWGQWTTFGGAGYVFNNNPTLLNYPYAGWTLTNQLNKRLLLGAEVYSQASSAPDQSAFTLLNLGGEYTLNEHSSLQIGAAHSFLGKGTAEGYVGFYWSW